ncbi:MAG: OmpA family protein [Colwellia sp.]
MKKSILLLLSLLPICVFAEKTQHNKENISEFEDVKVDIVSNTDTGAFIRLDLGQSFYFDACNDATTCIDDRTTWGISSGYFFSPQWGVEGGYFDLDNYQHSETTMGQYVVDELDTLDMQGVFRVKLFDPIKLDFKLGAGYWKSKSIGHSNNNTEVGSHSGIYPKAGVALNWKATNSIMLNVEYSHRFGLSGDTKIAGQDRVDVGTVYLGFSYLFGNTERTKTIARETVREKEVQTPYIAHVNLDSVKTELFALNSNKVINTAVLDELIKQLKTLDYRYITLIGHTDKTGSDSVNKKLSLERAKAVEAYLIKNGGVDPNSISSLGLGTSQPVAENSTEQGRALNRRVEVFIR